MSGGPVQRFSDVDAGDAAGLVAMMDATDRWAAVRAARAWVIEQAGPGGRSLDVGSGPGTFHASAGPSWTGVDLDPAVAMLRADRDRRSGVLAVHGDGAALPFPSGAFELVHAERVLQWSSDPAALLAELVRVAAPAGVVAVTDTDWSTFAIDHPDPGAARRMTDAALAWVTSPTFARSVPRRLADLGFAVSVRADAVALDAWDPDDPTQVDGPPGLPLRTIAAAGGPGGVARHDVDVLAESARSGRFLAVLTTITTVARSERC
jgi:SAM-dependent methyltransferase